MTNLRSPGAAASARIVSEQRLTRVLMRSTRLMLAQVVRMVEAGDLTAAVVQREWATVVANAVRNEAPNAAVFITDSLMRSGVPDDIYAAANAVLTDARQQGWSASQTRREARRMLTIESGSLAPKGVAEAGLATGGHTWRTRIERSARTAATAEQGFTRMEALRNEGHEYKRWVTRHDARVRPTHAAADGQTVPVDIVFNIDGWPLLFPGDPLGPPQEIIGCRCVIVGAERSIASPFL